MSTVQEQEHDEIDLRELLGKLWKNKFLIFAITFLFSISGIAYALLVTQEWSAKAEVTAPRITEVGQLRLKLEKIKAANPADRIDEFFPAFSEGKLLVDFIQLFNSFDNKCEFLETNGYVPEKLKEANSRQRFFEKTTKKITASQKKNETFYTLSFVADNAPEARKRLSTYIDFLQAKEVAMKNMQLNAEIANQRQNLVFANQVLNADTFKRLQEEITRTEFALRISKFAGVEGPVENLNNQSIFPIDLGAKALSEKYKILKEIKDPVIFNQGLADIRLRMDGLQALPQEMVSFTSYHFLQSPMEPLNRDKPKRLLVVAVATMAGFMLGVMVVLFRGSAFLRDGN
jgi:LPS O-antigen subunit length determinant protein (WzzB/FepE family)